MYSRFWLSWSVKVWYVSLIDDLRKFSSRSWQERWMFAEAFVLLGVMRAAIVLSPFRKITAHLGLTPGASPEVFESALSVKPTDIGWAIQAAAARTPWKSACLAQALTGMLMLGRRGINATLYLGVARDESGAEAMAAHAWLRCGDAILTGAGGVERYAALSSFSRSGSGDASRQGTHDRTKR
jgi:hypothetical protein